MSRRLELVCFLFCALLAGVNATAHAEEQEVRPPQRTALTIEDIYIADIRLTPGEDAATTEIDVNSIMPTLIYWLKPEVLAKLQAKIAFGRLSLSALKQVGITGGLEDKGGRATLSLSVPEKIRKPGAGVQPRPGDDLKGDSLFEAVFKKKKVLAKTLLITLVVQEEKTPDVRIDLDPEPGKIRVESGPVLKQLTSWISSEAKAKLEQKVSDGRLSIQDLRDSGLSAEFLDASLKLEVKVPVAMQTLQIRSLSNREEETDWAGVLHPSLVSGFLNTSASEDLQHGTVAGSTFNTNGLDTAFDGALNVGSLVLEGQGFYHQNDPYTWQRGDVRIVKDIPALMARASVGDLNFPVWGFGRSRQAGGVGLATEFGLKPNLLVTALSHREIELKYPSTVKILRNGIVIQTLQLKEGKYDLRDLPVINGPNDLTIEVTDPAGRTEKVELSQFYNSGFLAPGLSQISYNYGFPSIQSGPHRNYDYDRSLISLSHRIGILTELTAGGFFQREGRQTVFGATVLFPFAWGSMQLDAAKSATAEPYPSLDGAAFRSFYSFTSTPAPGSLGARTFGLGIERRTSGFTFFGEPADFSVFAWDFFGNFSTPLTKKLNLSLGADYALTRGSDGVLLPASYNLHTNLNKTFERGTSGTFSLGYVNRPGRVEISGTVFFNWSFPEEQQLIRASYDSASDRTGLAWDKNSASTVGAVRARGEFVRDPNGRSLGGTLGYIGNRGEVSLQEDLRSPGSDQYISDTRITASNAVAFAGTNFAFGRRVLDSFAIIQPSRLLKGQAVEVNPLGNGEYQAQTDFFGSALLPGLGSYYRNEVRLGEAQLKGSSGLPSNRYSLRPTYKSGLLVSLQTDYDVIMRGKLVKAGGGPLARISGEVQEKSSDATPAKTIPFFTNRAGIFQIEGLRAGKYQMRLFDDSVAPFDFVIPDDAAGLTEMGTLTVTLDQGAKP